MSNRVYDYPLTAIAAVAAGTTAVSVVGKTANLNRIKVLDAYGFYTATAIVAPANVINIGDGTDADRYGTITITPGSGANTALEFTLNLNQENYEIYDVERIVLTPNITAGSVTGLQVVVGYF